jgi:hypothetical protein
VAPGYIFMMHIFFLMRAGYFFDAFIFIFDTCLAYFSVLNYVLFPYFSRVLDLWNIRWFRAYLEKYSYMGYPTSLKMIRPACKGYWLSCVRVSSHRPDAPVGRDAFQR